MDACRSLGLTQVPAMQAGFRRGLPASKLTRIPNFQPFASPALAIHAKSQADDNTSNRMFILGMGYVGQFFAQQLKNEGWDVSGTCTRVMKKQELEERGFDVHVFDACQPEWEILDKLRCHTHLLVSIPPVEGIGDYLLQHEEHLKSKLMDGNLHWLCYLSSTSIYGDSKGAWIDEDHPPTPSNKLGKMRLKAEEGWLKLGQSLGISSYVFRLGGIYGPGRSAIDTILKNEPLSEGQKRRATRSFTSRVHVADICQTLRASISMQFQRKIYNVVDDDPASRAEVFGFAQQLIERKCPDLSHPTAFSIHSPQPKGGQKRVCNARIKQELGVKLLHSSYRSGLQSIIDNIQDPP